MKNLEILGIVNAYTAQKASVDKARQEGKPVEELKFPVAVAWKRRLNLDDLFRTKKLIDDALSEIKQRYFDEEHSEESVADNGERVRTVKQQYLADYMKEQGDVLSQDTDITIRKVKLSEIGNIALSDGDMDTLAFMIDGGD